MFRHGRLCLRCVFSARCLDKIAVTSAATRPADALVLVPLMTEPMLGSKDQERWRFWADGGASSLILPKTAGRSKTPLYMRLQRFSRSKWTQSRLVVQAPGRPGERRITRRKSTRVYGFRPDHGPEAIRQSDSIAPTRRVRVHAGASSAFEPSS
jgi:hypothetical protein